MSGCHLSTQPGEVYSLHHLEITKEDIADLLLLESANAVLDPQLDGPLNL